MLYQLWVHKESSVVLLNISDAWVLSSESLISLVWSRA